MDAIVTLTASSVKRNVTVWRPSVCLSHRHTHRDSPGGSMRRERLIFRPDNKDVNVHVAVAFSMTKVYV